MGTGKPCSLPTTEAEYCKFARHDLGASRGSDLLRVPVLPVKEEAAESELCRRFQCPRQSTGAEHAEESVGDTLWPEELGR